MYLILESMLIWLPSQCAGPEQDSQPHMCQPHVSSLSQGLQVIRYRTLFAGLLYDVSVVYYRT